MRDVISVVTLRLWPNNYDSCVMLPMKAHWMI